uniref:Uncharacterized protein n=1 Tax=Nelumbo nucifera TaxID=4432 RepID=A0A822Y2Y9_NELNU|nr:TPA_asm: hypothetical protein HUJ06_027811 [Nelumbo nucifera]
MAFGFESSFPRPLLSIQNMYKDLEVLEGLSCGWRDCLVDGKMCL